jgi:hypothetical protein
MRRFGRCRNVELRRRLKSAGPRRRCRRSGPGPPSPQPGRLSGEPFPRHGSRMGRSARLPLWRRWRALPGYPAGDRCHGCPMALKSRSKGRFFIAIGYAASVESAHASSIDRADRSSRRVYLVLKILERAPAAPGARRTKPIQTWRQSCSASSDGDDRTRLPESPTSAPLFDHELRRPLGRTWLGTAYRSALILTGPGEARKSDRAVKRPAGSRTSRASSGATWPLSRRKLHRVREIPI